MKNLISVTVMVRDSGKILDEFLKRLKAQKIDIPHELVVLYYGKDNETFNKLQFLTKNITRIKPKEFVFGKCRDIVCDRALGQYIVTASVDALPADVNWLRELIDPIRFGKTDVVQGGICCPAEGDPNYPDFFFWEKNFMFYSSSEGSEFIKRNGNIGFSCINLAFSKGVWEKIKFGGVSYCEDKIFQKRLFKSKFKFLYNKKALVTHAHSYKTIGQLFKRSSNEGLGWKEMGEIYDINELLRDISRLDLHVQAMQAFIQGKLKYPTEFFFFLLRPVALYWGSHFAKNVY